MSLVHQVLRQRRSELGLTLAQVSQAAGISITHLSDIEHGRRSPSLARVTDLALALGLHERDLVREMLQAAVDEAGLSLHVAVLPLR